MNSFFFSKKSIRKLNFCSISLPFLPPSSQTKSHSTRNKSLKGRTVLNLVSGKSNFNAGGRQSHLRLIQDILSSNSNDHVGPIISNSESNDGPFSVFIGRHAGGLRADPRVLSHALSLCVRLKTELVGIQAHCLAVKTGYFSNVYVGSSLVSFYCKCSELRYAYQVFDEMPVKNVVSWTTMIAGFAQEWQVGACLELYHRMRNAIVNPNDFTVTSLLSACTGSGCLGTGKSAHCQAIEMGFDMYVHVSNALISMYFKCGDENEAACIFENMWTKDLVSWNSMIAGYAQHGLSLQAIDVFEEMRKKKVKPDAITFLGVLSSCRHAGLVEQGQFYFNSMVEYGLEPEVDHYSCIVDLLGRAGDLEKAQGLIKNMPIDPNGIIWGSLLSSSRLHGNVWMGIEAAERRLELEPECAATHMQLVNLYASFGCWNQVANVRKMMKDKGLKTDPGHSWIEVRNKVYRFGVEDSLNSKTDKVLAVVDCLVDQIRDSPYVAELYQLEVSLSLYTEVSS